MSTSEDYIGRHRMPEDRSVRRRDDPATIPFRRRVTPFMLGDYQPMHGEA